ncbi:general vesicular transport factor p115-like isoform X2 [Paramacrobiotus metropolitanus]|uniref:general vesicular transport factor p115-like isoform X2 n=1 Tax=Paramacrobiotus metropolitanus TaxID=2943436 RepID=UPI0024460CC9|nr:general vesicular transport factor p115-like isoform X2 [Paramacrobiotus metropolitanus]
MSFLWKPFSGGKNEGSAPDRAKGLNEVEKLLHRIESVTLISDRRDGLRSLRKVAGEHRLEVGAHGMSVLLNILDQDRTDHELVAIALDILCVIMSDSPNIETELFESTKKVKRNEKIEDKDPAQSQGAQFTEIFLKKADHLVLLLDFVKEFNFQIRLPAVRLLCVMASNCPKTFQECLLGVPGGISSLMDLLTDNREIIRNDGVLLLCFITRSNPNLQKIVAFSKAFETILDMVLLEGCSEGGVVVEDCILLLTHLLANNASNIKLFREDGCIHKLLKWFTTDNFSSASWSDQRRSNAIGMMSVIRCLVSPLLIPQVVRSCQDAISKCGLLKHVCDILMTPGIPLTVLVQTLNTVAELIRGNKHAQEDFSAMEAPLNPPRPALAILLLSMFNDKQTFTLRLAVLYVLKCFLNKNESMQLNILHSINPEGNEPAQYTLGHLLAGALFSPDSLNQWCANIAFLHCIVDNREHKEFLLRSEFAPSQTLPLTTIMVQCGNILRDSSQLRSKVAVLQLLCIWLCDCPSAVAVFLRIPQITTMLLIQILDSALEPSQKLYQGLTAFLFAICINYDEDVESRRQLLDIVRNRIGFDLCKERVVEISRHESFVKASQHPDPAVESLDDLYLDYEFVKFFKAVEGKIYESLDPHYEERLNEDKERAAGLLNQQKEFIQAKDSRISELEAQLHFAQARIHEQSKQIDDLRNRSDVLTAEIHNRESDMEALQKEIRNVRSQAQTHHSATAQLETENLQLRTQLTAQHQTITELQRAVEQYHNLGAEVEQLRTANAQQQQQISAYYSYFEAQQQGGDASANLVMENADLTTKVTHLDSLLYSWQAECQRLQLEVAELRASTAKRDSVMQQTNTDGFATGHLEVKDIPSTAIQQELDHLKTKYADLNGEHADLLELLTDSDDKIQKYRDRLRLLGESVSDDDS